jgi:hypothetical protein
MENNHKMNFDVLDFEMLIILLINMNIFFEFIIISLKEVHV